MIHLCQDQLNRCGKTDLQSLAVKVHDTSESSSPTEVFIGIQSSSLELFFHPSLSIIIARRLVGWFRFDVCWSWGFFAEILGSFPWILDHPRIRKPILLNNERVEDLAEDGITVAGFMGVV